MDDGEGACSPTTPRPMATPKDYRYAPAARLHQVRTLLASSGGASVYDLAERFGVSVRTANRYLRALQEAGEHGSKVSGWVSVTAGTLAP